MFLIARSEDGLTDAPWLQLHSAVLLLLLLLLLTLLILLVLLAVRAKKKRKLNVIAAPRDIV